MSLANFLFEQISADPTLNNLGIVSDTIHRSAPSDIPNPSLTRFLVFSFGPESASPGRDTFTRPRDLSIWAYDREPTYSAVEAILDRVRAIMLSLEAVSHTAGAWITCVEWQGRSPDLQDDVYRAVVRNDSYRIIAN